MALTDYAIKPASFNPNLKYSFSTSHGDALDSSLLVVREQSDNSISDLTDLSGITVTYSGPLGNLNTSPLSSQLGATLTKHDSTGFEFTHTLAAMEGFCAAAITAGILSGGVTVVGTDGVHSCVVAAGNWNLQVIP